MTEQYTMPAKQRTISLVLMLVGAVAIIGGLAVYGISGEKAVRFWATILQNSIFFLLISVASIFILSATTLAQGAWIVAFRRVPEAIASNVWIFGIITMSVLLILVWGGHSEIYPWVKEGAITSNVVQGFDLNSTKKFFLNKYFFTAWSALIIFFWGFLGNKFRQISIAEESKHKGSTSTYWQSHKVAAGFVFVFALSLASTIPWLWIMSIDYKWFSTMFSWYTFASSFVSGMSLIMLWVLYLKAKGYYQLVSEEHIHDIGKFMFAFSIFWTYLWFSQFMLIWYANIPEETIYFQPRFHGPYKFFFWLNLILNFVSPILILMSRPAKRNYFIVSLVAIIILLGHWVDFYQMIMPGTVGDNWHLGLFELGVPMFFIGLMIYLTANKLSKAALTPQNHPFLKETIIHVV